jgi:hypothetical protein
MFSGPDFASRVRKFIQVHPLSLEYVLNPGVIPDNSGASPFEPVILTMLPLTLRPTLHIVKE